MASISYPTPSIGPVKVLTEPLTADSDVAQSTDLAVIPIASSDGVTEVSAGAGSWLSVMALG